ncbi:hypothetical protein, partial [Streptomyces roseolus]|uniref:hypothetical protein n=1 Tax=Streptomyces roseolus TaxID=67358 RepID=UPI003666A997
AAYRAFLTTRSLLDAARARLIARASAGLCTGRACDYRAVTRGMNGLKLPSRSVLASARFPCGASSRNASDLADRRHSCRTSVEFLRNSGSRTPERCLWSPPLSDR